MSIGELEWPTSTTADVQSFQYPADGSVVSIGRSRAAVFASPGSAAATQSFAEVIVVSLFNGEIVAGKITASVSAGASARSAGAELDASEVQGLRALGQDVASAPGGATLEDWGSLTVLSGSSGSRKAGPPAAQASMTALRIQLTAAHGGLPAGSEIVISQCSCDSRRRSLRAASLPRHLVSSVRRPRLTAGRIGSHARPSRTSAERWRVVPSRSRPRSSATLSSGGFVFPVYGTASFGDSFGASTTGRAGRLAPRRGHLRGGRARLSSLSPTGRCTPSASIGSAATALWLRDTLGERVLLRPSLGVLAARGRGAERQGGRRDRLRRRHRRCRRWCAASPLRDPPVVDGGAGVRRSRRAVLDPARVAAGGRHLLLRGTGLRADRAREAPSLPQPGAVLLEADDIASTSGLVPGALEKRPQRLAPSGHASQAARGREADAFRDLRATEDPHSRILGLARTIPARSRFRP